MSYCIYYQAQVEKSRTWFLVAILKSFDHLALDRTIDKNEGILEFFVPAENERYFLQLMNYFQKEGIVSHIKHMPNRLKNDHVKI